jgi:hypothetical protein
MTDAPGLGWICSRVGLVCPTGEPRGHGAEVHVDGAAGDPQSACRLGAAEGLADDERDDLAPAAGQGDVAVGQCGTNAPHHPSAAESMAVTDHLNRMAREPVVTSEFEDGRAVGQSSQDRSLLAFGDLGRYGLAGLTSRDARAVEGFADGLGIETEQVRDLHYGMSGRVERGRLGSSRRVGSTCRVSRRWPAAARAGSHEPKRARTGVGLGTARGCAWRRANLAAWPRRRLICRTQSMRAGTSP